MESRRAWAARRLALDGGRIVVAGAGSGWDAASWLPVRPALVAGADRYSFASAWQSVSALHPAVHFVQTDLGALPLRDGSVDAVVSDAVLEHLVDMDGCVTEMARVVRRGGGVYASYGPQWFCWGGDHLSGSDDIGTGYAHLELDPVAYRSHVAALAPSHADVQDGARFVELGLFSRARTFEYLAAFDRAGFALVELVLEVSPEGIAFRRRWPDRFAAIAAAHGCDQDDLLVKTSLVVLRRR